MSLLALVLAAAAATVTPPADADPLAPGRAGMLQCYQPDAARKTCSALAGYRVGADGVIVNRAEVLLSASPWITVVTESPVTVRAGAVCGPLTGVDTARVLLDGQPADAGTTARVRQALTAAYAPFAGKDICTTYIAEPAPFQGGYAYRAEATVGGDPRPDLTQRVIWVYPEGEWVVRP
jgi:hypothetical protein